MHTLRETVMDESVVELAVLQARHADAANGYEKGLEKADADIKPVLEKLKRLHEQASTETGEIVQAHGHEPKPDGSWLSIVHETMMTVRGIFDGIDDDIIPAIIDGEQRIADQIDTVLAQDQWSKSERQTIQDQRARIQAALASLREIADS